MTRHKSKCDRFNTKAGGDNKKEFVDLELSKGLEPKSKVRREAGNIKKCVGDCTNCDDLLC